MSFQTQPYFFNFTDIVETPMLLNIVIDKSFLQGAPSDRVHSLCIEHNVLMIDTLFRELMLTDEHSRTTCFRKFPAKDDPVIPIENVGGLTRYEIKHRFSCQPIHKRRALGSFRFHPRLAEGDFPFNAIQLQSIEDGKTELVDKVERHKQTSAVIIGWFPHLANYSPGQDTHAIEQTMEKVARDDDLIRNIYDQIKSPEWPKSEMLTKDWALFRWTQAHLLYAFEYIRQYGANPDVISGKLENELSDIDYCITGCLTGCLATKDHKMMRFFQLLCPSGTLIS